jgi:hypothetical protein
MQNSISLLFDLVKVNCLDVIDNEKQNRQYNNHQGRGKKPAGIGQV